MSNHTPIQLPLAIDGATVEIPLTRGYVAIVDAVDADLSVFTCQASVTGNRNFYATYYDGKRVFFHRTILSRKLGRELSPSEFVDHKDGDGLNNRRSNLRLADKSRNGGNSRRQSKNTSGFKGVSWDKARQKWSAHITVDYKHIFLGRFEIPEEAYEAYCKAAIKYFGEFARLE